MLSQLLIISRPIITRFRDRCSQLDTPPNPLIIQYVVFWRAGVFQPIRLDPLTPPERGGDCGTHTSRPFFSLFIKEWKKLSDWIQAGAAGLGLTQYWRDIARDARAFMWERERGRERSGRTVLRVCVCVCVTRARMESCQSPLLSDWCGDSCPPWGKVTEWNSDRFKWQLLLILVAKQQCRHTLKIW